MTAKMEVFLVSIIAILTILLLASNANAGIFNRFKKGFYFEKYKTSNDVKEALLKLHPPGSNVEELIKTIKKAGGQCAMGNRQTNELIQKISKPDDFYQCYYMQYGIPLIGDYSWRINIYLNSDFTTTKEIDVISGASTI